MSDLALKIEHLTVAYRDNPVLWDIDLEIPCNSFTAIVGPNGAGKSTLIKSILGLIKPVAGKISIFGKPYKNQRKLVAYVPQRASVDWDFPTTVFDLVLMGTYGSLGWIRRPGKKEKDETFKVLEKVGMSNFAKRQISELSGGQQQRLFIARALLQNAEIYLMDEPFQGVDATTEIALINLLKELGANGKTVICVHHDLITVNDYFDSVILINIRKIADGKVNDVLTDENLRKTYGGAVNISALNNNDMNEY